mmetsp:Transcript_10366/g.13474  ORF Transcript_10366/g.13474 Transcript_10366/m.13474 type:complete len:281 (+) Transcript_10366:72-914(+)|eukprot:CAMPEP_0117763198 /NCGR_PEP_ID=MMETSP0947-20121206/18475_1 /TAXON_ID=44440 /ORGANISM="Chattonella subsalsa, Strain CCMP2191" /LENGTH=280 /DNA_ID=CAMNT_0005584819 /DNA_START=83 /DNA_END=925 /DNA_ORIENTATION=+
MKGNDKKATDYWSWKSPVEVGHGNRRRENPWPFMGSDAVPLDSESNRQRKGAGKSSLRVNRGPNAGPSQNEGVKVAQPRCQGMNCERTSTVWAESLLSGKSMERDSTLRALDQAMVIPAGRRGAEELGAGSAHQGGSGKESLNAMQAAMVQREQTALRLLHQQKEQEEFLRRTQARLARKAKHRKIKQATINAAEGKEIHIKGIQVQETEFVAGENNLSENIIDDILMSPDKPAESGIDIRDNSTQSLLWSEGSQMLWYRTQCSDADQTLRLQLATASAL